MSRHRWKTQTVRFVFISRYVLVNDRNKLNLTFPPLSVLIGLKESPIMSHRDSELVHSILDEVRRQLGVWYPQDKV